MRRRGIVVVHGVGDQRRGQQLDTVVESVMRYLEDALGADRVTLVARTSPDLKGVARAWIQLRDEPTGPPVEQWHIREAWWAQAFQPSNSATILGWGILAFLIFITMTWANLWFAHRRPGAILAEVWRSPLATGALRALDWVTWLLISLAFAVLYLIGLLVIVPAYVLLLLPLGFLWPCGIGALQRGVMNLLTGGIGDQHAMTRRDVALAGAANVVATALYPFLVPRPRSRAAPAEVRSGERTPSEAAESNFEYETVTVIAHSGGAVVSLEGIDGEEVHRWIGATPRRINWITVGSGLHLAWNMRYRARARENAFWHRALAGHVNWINLYGRYDPVPQGPAPAAMVAAVMSGQGDASPTERPFVDVEVANQDWPLTEHGAYWMNDPEVMSRIVHVIISSNLSDSLFDPARSPFVAGTGDRVLDDLGQAVQRSIKQVGPHRVNVARRLWMRLGPGLLLAMALLVFHGPVIRLGRWVAGALSTFVPLPSVGQMLRPFWAWAAWPESFLTTIDGVVAFFIGAVVVGYVAMGIFILIGLLVAGVEWIAQLLNPARRVPRAGSGHAPDA